MTSIPNLRRRDALLMAGAGLASLSSAFALPEWPNRPVRMIVPSAPGSGADLLCRVFTEWLAQALKQPFIVDNKPGANGMLAADQLLHAAPDGYTFAWLSSSSTVINQALQPRLPFDVTTDMVPIVQVGAGGIHLVVASDFPARDLKSLVALLKASPGRYNYATWGIGSTGHLMMEWLKQQAGFDINHVPYKSMPQIYQDMQGGIVPIAWVDASSSVSLIKAGKLKGIVTSASRPGPALPELPTLTQGGYRFESDAWYGVFGPRGTSLAAVSAINRHVREALLAPSLKERSLALNLGDTPSRTPDEFAKVVRADLLVWQDIVRRNGIKIE